jgi:hypothetical protein
VRSPRPSGTTSSSPVAWRGWAAELAGRLAPGDACAVCGATEHPAPATPPAGGVVDEAQVRRAREHADGQAALRDEALAAVADLRRELAAAEAVAGDTPLAALRAAAAEAAAAHAGARAEATRAGALAAELRALDAGREEALAARGASAVAAAAAGTEADARAGALEGERAAVHAARAGHPTVAARVAELEDTARRCEAAAQAAEAAGAARAEAGAAGERAAAAAAAAGFADVAALTGALRPPERVSALERQVGAWDAGLVERRTAAAREDLVAAAGAPAPDVAARAAEAQAAAAAAERAQRDLAIADARATGLADLEPVLAAAVAEAGPARTHARLVRELAGLADGTSASNRKRMRLSAYVLAARLEEVAAAASVRLAQMSGGRYALEHADDGAHGGRRGGLDLVVVDAWTGRARVPASLSGGETFQASLALALGLADVVTAEAGGARLETLFIDEGFGSLDDEGSLDEVLDVLDRLRDGGRAGRDRVPRRRAAPAHPDAGARGEGARGLAGPRGLTPPRRRPPCPPPRRPSPSSRTTRTRRSPGCGRRRPCAGSRRSTGGSSRGATSCSRSCATPGRSPSTTRASRPAASSGRACSAATAPSTAATASRSRPPFRRRDVLDRFSGPVAAEVDRLIDGFAADGRAELRTAFAGPLAAAVVAHALGLGGVRTSEVLGWYAGIVGAVTAVSAGRPLPEEGPRGFAALAAAMEPELDRDARSSLVAAAAAGAGALERHEVVANAAVLLFGGIETTEGMIATAIAHLLGAPEQLALVRPTPALLPGAVEESLRLEPAAATVDRYATRDVALGGAGSRPATLVLASIAAANRDLPHVPRARRPRRPPRAEPARDVRRGAARLHRDAPGPARGARRARPAARAPARAGPRSGP